MASHSQSPRRHITLSTGQQSSPSTASRSRPVSPSVRLFSTTWSSPPLTPSSDPASTRWTRLTVPSASCCTSTCTCRGFAICQATRPGRQTTLATSRSPTSPVPRAGDLSKSTQTTSESLPPFHLQIVTDVFCLCESTWLALYAYFNNNNQGCGSDVWPPGEAKPNKL